MGKIMTKTDALNRLMEYNFACGAEPFIDLYSYEADNFWALIEPADLGVKQEADRILVMTSRGKVKAVSLNKSPEHFRFYRVSINIEEVIL